MAARAATETSHWCSRHRAKSKMLTRKYSEINSSSGIHENRCWMHVSNSIDDILRKRQKHQWKDSSWLCATYLIRLSFGSDACKLISTRLFGIKLRSVPFKRHTEMAKYFPRTSITSGMHNAILWERNSDKTASNLLEMRTYHDWKYFFRSELMPSFELTNSSDVVRSSVTPKGNFFFSNSKIWFIYVGWSSGNSRFPNNAINCAIVSRCFLGTSIGRFAYVCHNVSRIRKRSFCCKVCHRRVIINSIVDALKNHRNWFEKFCREQRHCSQNVGSFLKVFSSISISRLRQFIVAGW